MPDDCDCDGGSHQPPQRATDFTSSHSSTLRYSGFCALCSGPRAITHTSHSRVAPLCPSSQPSPNKILALVTCACCDCNTQASKLCMRMAYTGWRRTRTIGTEYVDVDVQSTQQGVDRGRVTVYKAKKIPAAVQCESGLFSSFF